MNNNTEYEIRYKAAFLLVAICFLSYGSYSWASMVVMIPILLFSKRRVHIDLNFILITLAMLSYVAIGNIFDAGVSAALSLLIAVPLSYISGKYIAGQNSELSLMKVLVFLAVITGALAILSVIMEISSSGFVGSSRNIMFIGANDRILSATGMAARMSILIGLIGMVMVKRNSKRQNKLRNIILFFGVLAVICSLRLGTRTSIVLLLVSVITAFLMNFKNYNLGQKVVFFLLTFLTIYGIIYFFSSNSFLLEYFKDRMDLEGAGISSGGGRFEIQRNIIELIPKYPMGSIPAGSFGGNYAHNLWLDVARVSGIIPMTLLIILTIRFIADIIYVCRMKRLSLFFRTMILLIFIDIMLQMSVEPVLEGMLVIFMYFCFLGGVMRELRVNPKIIKIWETK